MNCFALSGSIVDYKLNICKSPVLYYDTRAMGQSHWENPQLISDEITNLIKIQV